MLYRDTMKSVISDEPTAVLTPQEEIDELMEIAEKPGGGRQVHSFRITHKLDREIRRRWRTGRSVLRRGRNT
ncbi:MAG: hypothetical protein ACLTBV_29990 [Enterocloster bolteae]